VNRRTFTGVSAVGALVLACYGCSDDEPDATSEIPASEASRVEATPTATPAPTTIPTIVSVPTTVAAPRVTTFDLPGGPDWMASTSHGLWIHFDNDTLTLFNPETMQPIGEIDLGNGQHPCQGLGSDGTTVWSCADSGVVGIDPETFEIVKTIDVAKTFAQGELAAGDGRLWVLTGDGSELAAVDTSTGAVVATLALPARGTDLALGSAGLWIVSGPDDLVMHVDPAAATLVTSVEVANPIAIAVDAEVWVGRADETLRLDPTSGEIALTVRDHGVGPGGALALSPGFVWIRNIETLLTKIVRETGALAETLTADVETPGDMIYAFGAIYTAANDEETVFRVLDV
jgi:outer membrane protein assembly factor BamB